ncbi:site-specific integrase [Enterococcus nangangensis]
MNCNPFRDVGRVRAEPKKIRFWTIDVFQKFESCLFPKSLETKVFAVADLTLTEYNDFFDYLYFRFLFFSGVRFGESATLLWENINVTTGLVKIMYTIGNTAGKKSEQYFSTPKSKSSIRDLYLDSRTIDLMKIWKIYQQRSGDIKLVFSHDDLFLSQSWTWTRFRTFQDKYKLPRISIHDLRHSHASLLIHLGENPKMLQKRLGHAHIEMTLGTYAHLYPNSDQRTAQKLDIVGKRKETDGLNDVLTN